MIAARALVVLFTGAAGCSVHVHSDANAPGTGDARTIPGDLESRTPERPADPGEKGIWMRFAATAGGGAAPAADGEPGYVGIGPELSVMAFEREESHSRPRFADVIAEQPVHAAVGYLLVFDGTEGRDAYGAGRVYAELQYESYMDDDSVSPGFLLGLGPFFEHGENELGVHASICGWFIGTQFVRPCVRPALRTDTGFELGGFVAVQGYLEWMWSR